MLLCKLAVQPRLSKPLPQRWPLVKHRPTLELPTEPCTRALATKGSKRTKGDLEREHAPYHPGQKSEAPAGEWKLGCCAHGRPRLKAREEARPKRVTRRCWQQRAVLKVDSKQPERRAARQVYRSDSRGADKRACYSGKRHP